jgi:hypothetical protein
MTNRSKLISRLWSDEEFLKDFREEPEENLRMHGIPVPSSVKVKVLENQPDHFYLVLTPKPTEPLSAEHLALHAEAGGSFNGFIPL